MKPRIVLLAPRYSDECNSIGYMSKTHCERNELYPEEDHVEIAADVSAKGSLLNYIFSQLFAVALNARDAGECTHALLMHSDISAPFGFANSLYQAMRQNRLAAVSAVVPIKEHQRVRTSTAVGVRGDSFGFRRFINVSDRHGMPETFTTKDVAQAEDEVLLINTGLLLIDLSFRDWDNFWFESKDKIRKNPETGRYEALVSSEDWEMSRWMDSRGMPFGAHWLSGVRHYGPDYWTVDELPPVYPKFVKNEV